MASSPGSFSKGSGFKLRPADGIFDLSVRAIPQSLKTNADTVPSIRTQQRHSTLFPISSSLLILFKESEMLTASLNKHVLY